MSPPQVMQVVLFWWLLMVTRGILRTELTEKTSPPNFLDATEKELSKQTVFMLAKGGKSGEISIFSKV